jgi:hypothetical protein
LLERSPRTIGTSKKFFKEVWKASIFLIFFGACPLMAAGLSASIFAFATGGKQRISATIPHAGELAISKILKLALETPLVS